MDEAVPVDGAEGRRELQHDALGPVPHQRPLLVEERPEARALEDLHREEDRAFARAAAVEDLDDVLVPDAREGPRLLEELVDGGGVGARGLDDLDGDGPVGVQVLREVDPRAAARLELAHEAVAIEKGLTEQRIAAAAYVSVGARHQQASSVVRVAGSSGDAGRLQSRLFSAETQTSEGRGALLDFVAWVVARVVTRGQVAKGRFTAAGPARR